MTMTIWPGCTPASDNSSSSARSTSCLGEEREGSSMMTAILSDGQRLETTADGRSGSLSASRTMPITSAGSGRSSNAANDSSSHS